MLIALARKLIVALWRYVEIGLDRDYWVRHTRQFPGAVWQPEGAIDASGEGQAFAMIVLGITVAHERALSKAR
jgi:hypothetical protein